MTTSDARDPIALLSRALDQAGVIIAKVSPDQAALPTPCRSWDVRALVNHVVQDVRMFTASAGGAAWQPGDEDLIGDDWTGTYQHAAEALLGAWQAPGILDRTLRLPIGEVPASWSVHQQVTDLAVHAWDVAKATGQPTNLDPEIGQLSLDWAKRNLAPQFRGDEASGKAFGDEVPVPDDAPLYDRLAGFFGRDPN
ncbi:MAG TPA: TIGR03086 family metal-binding protein [Actinomycetota bacterium]